MRAIPIDTVEVSHDLCGKLTELSCGAFRSPAEFSWQQLLLNRASVHRDGLWERRG